MDELEVLMKGFKNAFGGEELQVKVKLSAYADEKETIKLKKEIYKNKNTGILKVKLDSKMDTEAIKCVHKLENETNLKMLCSKIKGNCDCECCKKKDFNLLAAITKIVDLSVGLSLLDNMDSEKNDDEVIVTANLRGVASELIEDEFDCFNEGANQMIVNVSKLAINEIASEKYDEIKLKIFVKADILKKVVIEGKGKHHFELKVKID